MRYVQCMKLKLLAHKTYTYVFTAYASETLFFALSVAIRQLVICAVAIGGWAITFRTVRRGLGAAAPPSPLIAVPNVTDHPSTTHCTNFILFDVALKCYRFHQFHTNIFRISQRFYRASAY